MLHMFMLTNLQSATHVRGGEMLSLAQCIVTHEGLFDVPCGSPTRGLQDHSYAVYEVIAVSMAH